MSSRDYIKHLVANTSSTSTRGNLGDEVFDPTSNKLYKTIAVNGTAVSIVQIPYIQANSVFQVDSAKNGMFFENSNVLGTNYTITSGKNAGSFGPIIIADGVTVTVPTGSVWSIV